MRLSALLVATAALLVSAVAAETHTVVVAPSARHAFDPASLTIRVGDAVHFRFASSGHSVTHGDNCTPGGEFDVQGDALVQFDDAGDYPYFCKVGRHCRNGMTGMIKVVAAREGGAADGRSTAQPVPEATSTSMAVTTTPEPAPTPVVPAPTPTVPTQEAEVTLTVDVPAPTKTATPKSDATRPHAWLALSVAMAMACAM